MRKSNHSEKERKKQVRVQGWLNETEHYLAVLWWMDGLINLQETTRKVVETCLHKKNIHHYVTTSQDTIFLVKQNLS